MFSPLKKGIIDHAPILPITLTLPPNQSLAHLNLPSLLPATQGFFNFGNTQLN